MSEFLTCIDINRSMFNACSCSGSLCLSMYLMVAFSFPLYGQIVCCHSHEYALIYVLVQGLLCYSHAEIKVFPFYIQKRSFRTVSIICYFLFNIIGKFNVFAYLKDRSFCLKVFLVFFFCYVCTVPFCLCPVRIPVHVYSTLQLPVYRADIHPQRIRHILRLFPTEIHLLNFTAVGYCQLSEYSSHGFGASFAFLC